MNPEQKELEIQYELHCRMPSDINEHLPAIRKFASECTSVVELGVRNMVSTWALLFVLAECSSLYRKTYLGVDLELPSTQSYFLARDLCQRNGIAFDFLLENDLKIHLFPTDLLFIDTIHTYAHLTYELETFFSSTKKYIVIHDTGAPFSDVDSLYYKGDFSEYPAFIDRTKRGTWTAVEDFLTRHPEWAIAERHHNSFGLTVLKKSSYETVLKTIEQRI